MGKKKQNKQKAYARQREQMKARSNSAQGSTSAARNRKWNTTGYSTKKEYLKEASQLYVASADEIFGALLGTWGRLHDSPHEQTFWNYHGQLYEQCMTTEQELFDIGHSNLYPVDAFIHAYERFKKLYDRAEAEGKTLRIEEQPLPMIESSIYSVELV